VIPARLESGFGRGWRGRGDALPHDPQLVVDESIVFGPDLLHVRPKFPLDLRAGTIQGALEV
jgi:hypothetical protein